MAEILTEALVGPSSSHTVGPMRAGKIFITDLEELCLLDKVRSSPLHLCTHDIVWAGPYPQNNIASHLPLLRVSAVLTCP